MPKYRVHSSIYTNTYIHYKKTVRIKFCINALNVVTLDEFVTLVLQYLLSKFIQGIEAQKIHL